jgi:hypothetical protein
MLIFLSRVILLIEYQFSFSSQLAVSLNPYNVVTFAFFIHLVIAEISRFASLEATTLTLVVLWIIFALSKIVASFKIFIFV